MLTDLADACRASGLRVLEEPGWRTRGHGRKIDPNFDMAAFRAAVARLDTQEDDMTPEQARQLAEVHAWIKGQEIMPLDYRPHHGNPLDNQYGHTMSVRQRLDAVERKLDALLARLESRPQPPATRRDQAGGGVDDGLRQDDAPLSEGAV